jgi:pyruvate/2-oxoglutarate dehydrogenase complex dihydrolipoamide dehydrogenase (E3) component
LNRLFTHEFIHTYTGCRVVKVSRNSDLKQVYLEDGTVLEAEEILVTTGRWGVTEGLNLQNAGVETDENGIIVDTMLRTTAENIWAIGDVVGPYRYTHIANYHAVIAVQNAFKEAERAVNYKTIPFVIFTEPQVAFVGLTEEMAHRQCLSVMVMKSSATEPTRFKTDSDSMGFTKVIIDAENDQIVGAHIIASQAGEMIHLLSLAMENQLSVSQITKMVYAYPTKMQLIQKTLEPYPREKARILEFARTQA